MNQQQQQSIEKENYESYMNEINYYQRRAQKNFYDYIMDKLARNYILIIFIIFTAIIMIDTLFKDRFNICFQKLIIQDDITFFNIATDEEKRKKQICINFIKTSYNIIILFSLLAEINKFVLLFALQNYLLDNQLGLILQNHRDYEKMKPEIEKYENALDMRAKAEIQNMYLQKALQDMDFLKKSDINQLSSEQKQ